MSLYSNQHPEEFVSDPQENDPRPMSYHYPQAWIDAIRFHPITQLNGLTVKAKAYLSTASALDILNALKKTGALNGL